jgi:glutamate formiminotransferase/formiminotetrahydrofolate cyclodeaminase
VNALVECIPNFSEGRRAEVVAAIVAAIQSVPGVSVLDYSSDADHNRSVVTFVGPPEGVEEAAFAAIQTAAGLIDMTRHTGEHPRIGATDVVPFVPIRGVTMADCVAMAGRLGRRVGDELGIPIYLYEAAATRPERENLANLRKGEYEGLREVIKTDPDRAPDFGPSELGTAGATVIGARAPLIAYNIYLNTSDVAAADRIAKAIRHSGGGLRFVKALGMSVEGRAQVSMNLTDYRKTPIHRVQELVRLEAQRYGYDIACSELIGLIPEQALIDAAKWYLQLDLFDEHQILEWQIKEAEARDYTPVVLLDAVASGEPAPGGGSVAAVAGALGAALATMVARLTLGKKKYADVEGQIQAALDRAEALRTALSRAIMEDGQAYERVMEAYRLPKEAPERPAAIQAALRNAADVPLQTARLALEALEALRVVAELGNVNAATDAASGAHMAMAAVECALLNVLVNAQSLEDADAAAAYREEANALRATGKTLAQEIQEIAIQRLGL